MVMMMQTKHGLRHTIVRFAIRDSGHHMKLISMIKWFTPKYRICIVIKYQIQSDKAPTESARKG